MTTVVFADRDGSAFGALSDLTVPALLPLQSTPVLERALEALVANGLRSVLLVTGERSAEIQKRFGKGLRWGIALEYVRREDTETPSDVLHRLEQRLDGDTLVVRADVATEAAFGEFLEKIDGRTEPILAATHGGRLAGFWRLQPGALKKTSIPREPSAPDWVLQADQTPVELNTPVKLLDSLSAYRTLDRRETPSISDRATVDPKAKIGPGTTVAEDAVVCPGVSLVDVSVLPRTVIPFGVTLQRAIVAGNLVIDPETGKASALSDLIPQGGKKDPSPGFGSRLAGFLLFLLSLPAWPVALLWSLVANAGHARRPYTFAGHGPSGRTPVRTFVFETAVPVLRDLPLVLALLAGKIALTGVAPLSPSEEDALPPGWQQVRNEAPVGLIAASRLIVPPSAPEDVVRLVDSFEARRPMPGLVGLGVSSLFGAKAWTAPKAFNPDDIKQIPMG
jgi:hypothetical protein